MTFEPVAEAYEAVVAAGIVSRLAGLRTLARLPINHALTPRQRFDVVMRFPTEAELAARQ